jgi:hypothetical protein
VSKSAVDAAMECINRLYNLCAILSQSRNGLFNTHGQSADDYPAAAESADG